MPEIHLTINLSESYALIDKKPINCYQDRHTDVAEDRGHFFPEVT